MAREQSVGPISADREAIGSASAYWLDAWSTKASRLAESPLHIIDGYHFMSAEAYARMVRAVAEPMHMRAGQRVVEVGCGTLT